MFVNAGSEDALLAALSKPEGSRLQTRRSFLRLVAAGMSVAAASQLLAEVAVEPGGEAWAAEPIGPKDRILVLVGLFGGNDGLNTVVPTSDGRYYDLRGSLAIQPETTLRIDDDFGFNPNLPGLKSLYDEGRLAIVHGVGVPEYNLSHFVSMATWMTGSGRVADIGTGWIGRWLDEQVTADLFTVGTIGTGLPLHLVGARRRGTTIPDGVESFGARMSPRDRRLYEGIRSFAHIGGDRGAWHDAIAIAERSDVDVAEALTPILTPPTSSGPLASKLVSAARLINADIGFRILDTALGGFDTHSNQAVDHASRMKELDDGIQQFFKTLEPSFVDRVVIMTYSEFGRVAWSNASGGTDHGAANSLFVIGPVDRGQYGVPLSLESAARPNRIAATTDFRSIYSTVIDGCLGGGSSAILGEAFEDLGIFRT